MNKTGKPGYPENIYNAVFCGMKSLSLPSDAEESLEYVMYTLNPVEADMLMLKYMQGIGCAEIGKKYNMNIYSVLYIIINAENKLRHSNRSKILLMGKKDYFASIFSANGDKRNYGKRIAELVNLV